MGNVMQQKTLQTRIKKNTNVQRWTTKMNAHKNVMNCRLAEAKVIMYKNYYILIMKSGSYVKPSFLFL